MESEHQHEAKAGKEQPEKTDQMEMSGESEEGGKSSDKDGAMDMSHGAGEEAKGEAIIGEYTVWWMLAGVIIGGAVGWFIGLAFGYGKFNLPGLAPLAAGDGLVAGFLFGSFFGSLFGLIGAIYGTLLDDEKMSEEMSGSKMSDKKMSGEMKHDEKKPEGEKKPEKMKHGAMKHGKSSFVSQLPIYGSIALALFFAYTLYNIASRALGSGEASDQSNRVSWNQKNAVRVGGQTDAETYSNALQIAFPATRAENSPKSVINLPDDWRVALAYTPLIARPNNAALLTTDAQNENKRLNARGNVAGETASGSDAAQIAASVDDRLAQTTGNLSQNVIIVSIDADSRFALPAAAYSARTGTPVLFVGRDNVPTATISALQKRGNQAQIFVLGSTDIVSANIFDQLKQFGAV